MSMALVISTYLVSTDKTPEIAAMVIALVACAFAGFVSGFFVVKLKVNSFIATLGMSQVIVAVVAKISDQSINDPFSDSYRNIGRQELFGLPLYWYYMMLLAVIVWYVFEHTPVGRHMFAVGGNPEAARLAGLRSDRLVWGSLVASGAIAGFAGIIYGWKVGNYAIDGGSRLPVPGDRRRLLRRLAVEGPSERLGHVHRPLRPGMGHQGPAAHLHHGHAVDRAAVPGRVAAGSRVARQPQAGGQGAEAQAHIDRGSIRLARRPLADRRQAVTHGGSPRANVSVSSEDR